MLTQRQSTILNAIIKQYIASAIPVPSEAIAGDYPDKISSATIRNEMAYLENEQYIVRPHISAGGIPSDRGYRYYVESLMQESELPLNEQRTIRHLFYQVEQQVEEWARLAATILSGEVMNIALVTLPKSNEAHLKHLEFVAVKDSAALLVILLQNAKIRQQLISFNRSVTQEELDTVSNKLNSIYRGQTGIQIRKNYQENTNLSSIEKDILKTLVQTMDSEDRQFGEPCLDGLRYFLNQPEFAHTKELWNIVEMLEERYLFKSVLSVLGGEGGVRVIIGDENSNDTLKKCSLVLGTYGIQEETKGVVGVVGPTRMQYQRVIAAVQYLCSIMDELVSGVYSGE